MTQQEKWKETLESLTQSSEKDAKMYEEIVEYLLDPAGRLMLCNKATGEERVISFSYRRMKETLAAIEQPLKELFGIDIHFDEEEASAESEQWAARIVTEKLFRQEHNLPPEGE